MSYSPDRLTPRSIAAVPAYRLGPVPAYRLGPVPAYRLGTAQAHRLGTAQAHRGWGRPAVLPVITLVAIIAFAAFAPLGGGALDATFGGPPPAGGSDTDARSEAIAALPSAGQPAGPASHDLLPPVPTTTTSADGSLRILDMRAGAFRASAVYDAILDPLAAWMEQGSVVLVPLLPVRTAEGGEIVIPTVGRLAGKEIARPTGSFFVAEPDSVRVSRLAIIIYSETDAVASASEGSTVAVRSTFTAAGQRAVAAAAAELPDLVHAWSGGRVSLDVRVAHVSRPLTGVRVTRSTPSYLVPDEAVARADAERAGIWDSERDTLMVIWPRPQPYAHSAGDMTRRGRDMSPTGTLPALAYRPLGLSLRSAPELDGADMTMLAPAANGGAFGGAYPAEGLLHEWLHTFIWTASERGGPAIDLDHPPADVAPTSEGSWAGWYVTVLATICDELDLFDGPAVALPVRGR